MPILKLVDKLVEECTENIDGVKIAGMAFLSIEVIVNLRAECMFS